MRGIEAAEDMHRRANFHSHVPLTAVLLGRTVPPVSSHHGKARHTEANAADVRPAIAVK